VNQAFDVPKPGEEAAAIECAGSEARLREIATAVGEYFREWTEQELGIDPAG
jgi:hypothetical protein